MQSQDGSVEKKSKPSVCVQLGPLRASLCAELTFILKSDFIWNRAGEGRGGVGILPLTVNLKKGQMHQFDWRAVKTGEGSCFQRTGLFYASVLLVLLRSAVFLAVITCPSQHPAAPSPNCQKSDVPRRPWRGGLYSGPRLLCADTFFFFLKDRKVSRDQVWIASTRSFVSDKKAAFFLAWWLYFRTRQHLSAWDIFVALHSCLTWLTDSSWFMVLHLRSFLFNRDRFTSH